MKNIGKKILGMEGGLCDQVRAAAAELTKVARDLRSTVNSYGRAPDPFSSLLTSVWNNHEFVRLHERGVDGAGSYGVGGAPIETKSVTR